jgi:hypothetical protein
VSIGWEGKPIPGLGFGDGWAPIIEDYNATTGMTWPFQISNAADSWSIPGLAELQDSEDVVPSCVALDLEVQSEDLTPIRDTEANYRFDGSTTGIYYYISPTNHEHTHGTGEPAVTTATQFIERAYGWL